MAWDTVSTSSSLQNKLFLLTRWRLAGIYASVVGLICVLAGFILYHAIAHTRLAALDRELESVASTLHDSLEPSVVYPSRVKPEDARRILPSICTDGISCLTQTAAPKSHSTGVFYQSNYYLRLLDTSGSLVAVAGFHPTGLPILLEPDTWQILQDRNGQRYRQISLSIHINKNLLWGYIQVGRSLEDFDQSLAYLRLILLAGIPIGIIAIGASAWWFSGLIIRPIYNSYLKMRQFTADAAHELRTPIATIQATIENKSQSEPWFEQEIENALTTIERQNIRLSRLVEDLLLLSRMENPAKTLHKQQALVMKLSSCNLNELVSDVIEGFSILKIAANLKLTADIRVRQALYVTGDEEHLGRLISNLASNAMQYTPPGGRVTIVLDRHEHYAVIQIVDTGIGIAPEHQARIFDRFYRVNSDRSRQSGGAGLGLAIAQAIAQAHHGSIQVQSELGRGSTFTVRLPLN